MNNILWADGADASQDLAAISCDRTCYLVRNIVWSKNGMPEVSIDGLRAPHAALDPALVGVDPEWFDVSEGDLRLRAGSPAIDAGTSFPESGHYPTDHAGGAVPNGSAPDIGAFEATQGGD